MNSDYDSDNSFSRKCQPAWDKYYRSKEFQIEIQKLYKKGKVEVTKIERGENPLFQAETFLDVVISLNMGSSLKIDEKAYRYPPAKPEYLDTLCVEVVSNPNKGGKSDGWGYHIGTTMVVAYFDTTTFEMKTVPTIFNVTHSFVENVTRNNEYYLIQNKPTNGLYVSSFRSVPKKIVGAYWP